MLCVHGGAAHAHWYDYVAPGFTDRFHVLSVDLRGHGDSDWVESGSYTYADYAADLDKFASKLDLRDFVLVGHSMGGTVCLQYAASHPERVAKFIIVDSTVNLSPERIAALRDVGTRPPRDYDTLEEMVERYKLRPGTSTAPQDVVQYIARHSARQFPNGKWNYKFDRNVYATREVFDGTPLWSKIRVPALLVKGDQSERINAQVFAEVKALCPQAQLAEVKNSGHHVTLDNPDGFIEAVNRFVS